ncbi:hypothetical protein P691DRAFT_674663 [Macrolepiota fuliginosa MF-IS2]|uniref:Uncharacterized protein n=1 Tax=Macrolepiota fuliginosa MF-IS2 TaxID=1400762 RepID=A0A9P5XA68_9AGAR|nr:hypothetical protein P691DRAFT_674663 [Macrolepiota fuliginosa MF-IS2]
MAPKGHRTGSTAQLRTHSRSSSTSRVGTNLQLTQKEPSNTKGPEKSKKNPHVHEGERPGLPRANSGQRVPAAAQVKKAESATNATQRKANAAKENAGFTLSQAAGDEDDEDEWVSSSGAQTPNQNDSDSDTASEGGSIPQELLSQLQRAQLEQEQNQAVRTQAPVPRIETARQSDFSAAIANVEVPGRNSDLAQHEYDQTQLPPDHADIPSTSHTRTESRQSHQPKRQSITRPPSTHSISSRLEGMRPHPLIRGHSQGHLNFVPKPTPLTPLTVISDQPSSAPDSSISTSPVSVRTTATSPGGYYVPEFPQERRTSISSVRSVATLPVQSAIGAPRPYDRTRTLSTMSMTGSTTALSSLTHLPSVTRPPSPQQISFFPPVNPHVNIEAIHPLLPGPYLNNHLTVLARRIPLRESYDRVIQAKIVNGR